MQIDKVFNVPAQAASMGYYYRFLVVAFTLHN